MHPQIHPPKSFLFLLDLLLSLQKSVKSELGVFRAGLLGFVLLVESLADEISLFGMLLCSKISVEADKAEDFS